MLKSRQNSRLPKRNLSKISGNFQINIEKYGNYYLYSVYNSYSNTQLIIDVEGPGKIVFNSTSEANAFVNKAISLGYFSWQNGKYYITYEPEFCGICAMRLSGNTVIFDLIVL